MVHLLAVASYLPDTPMMVYGTGRRAHFNVKLHFFNSQNHLFFLHVFFSFWKITSYPCTFGKKIGLMVLNISANCFRVKKHFKGRCSWRCIALVLMFLTVILLAIIAYFIGKSSQSYQNCIKCVRLIHYNNKKWIGCFEITRKHLIQFQPLYVLSW